ncbi:hypothetical protein L2Y94_06650 [Luteibacter aegosomatis]|uniref:hypothetical protein n=1 Tax=Luteibacter aegosomatis TaxID=2911537 RepID=UPI001FFA0A5E|nr:hypothetical protein [Luteibacter aegosomatis]UPG87031.1 hypothetical protein L2Y94_06650 [Luteibacter aegosomatis]
MSTSNTKNWEGLTITRDLKVGVLFAGTRHKKFTLRVPMAGDLINAQKAYPSGPIRLQALECYRQQLLELGDIPAESLTIELLSTELAEVDLGLLEVADEELGKSLNDPPEKADSETGG